MTRKRTGVRAEHRVIALALTLLAISATIAGVTERFADLEPPRMVVLLALGAGFAISERLTFYFETKSQGIGHKPTDIGLALGIVFVNPLALVAIRVIGSTAGIRMWRPLPPIKLAFNIVNVTLETVVAVAVLSALRVDHTQASLSLVAGLMFAIVIAVLSSGFAVSAAVSCFEGDVLNHARQGLQQAIAVFIPVAMVASVVAVATLSEVWLGITVLATIGPIVWWLIKSHGALQQKFNDLTSVHLFTSAVGNEADPAAILERGVMQIAENLRAESVAIRVWGPDGDCSDFGVGPAQLIDTLPTCADDVRELHARASGSGAPRIVAPLGDERGVLGAIAIEGRLGVSNDFDRAARSRLSSMVSQLAVAVRKSQLYSQIQYDATHDRLTGLSNRSFFEAWVGDACKAEAPGAVLLMDLDRFKEVNDAFGHDAGDRLLQACADRFTTAVPDGSVVARFGGDEFAIYAPGLDARGARDLAARLTAAIDEPFVLAEASVAVTSSIGIALAPEHGTTASELLRRADIAMYDAKRRYSRFTVYHTGLDENDAARLSLIADLRKALTNGDLDVHYQPKVDIATGQVVSAEALVRWQHPDEGTVGPDVFVELAEQAGMIEPLTDAVMQKAVEAAASWQRRGWKIGVAVNISAQSLLDERLVEMVSGNLRRTGLDATLLTLEITESVMMGDPDRTDRMLHRLTAIGVGISVDDFGTGFSSLTSLRQLPVTELKIDRSFVSAMHESHHDAVIVRSTIDLARNLGLRTVAEGVESQEVLAELGMLRCDLAQGFGISRPMPYDTTTAWIAARTADDAAATTWAWGDHEPLSTVAALGPLRDDLDQIESNASKSSSNAVI